MRELEKVQLALARALEYFRRAERWPSRFASLPLVSGRRVSGQVSLCCVVLVSLCGNLRVRSMGRRGRVWSGAARVVPAVTGWGWGGPQRTDEKRILFFLI